jgi:hypothetical protein
MLANRGWTAFLGPNSPADTVEPPPVEPPPVENPTKTPPKPPPKASPNPPPNHSQTSFHRPNLVFRVVPKVEQAQDGADEAPCMTSLIRWRGVWGGRAVAWGWGRAVPRLTNPLTS